MEKKILSWQSEILVDEFTSNFNILLSFAMCCQTAIFDYFCFHTDSLHDSLTSPNFSFSFHCWYCLTCSLSNDASTSYSSLQNSLYSLVSASTICPFICFFALCQTLRGITHPNQPCKTSNIVVCSWEGFLHTVPMKTFYIHYWKYPV